ncbi:hypothetical protein [Brachymonas denitrificans]|jgi:hypothetical protein|uniref:hypothetical protein n=1 Tax=Brachymonas denitrificans TaxID=28220 RepID=UPI001BCEA3EF|nr:hypothetical protein [Brachymonas denitrificans]
MKAPTTSTTPASNAEFWCEERQAIALETLYQIEQMAEMLRLRAEFGDMDALQYASRAAARAIAELACNAMAAINDELTTIKSMEYQLGKGGAA